MCTSEPARRCIEDAGASERMARFEVRDTGEVRHCLVTESDGVPTGFMMEEQRGQVLQCGGQLRAPIALALGL
jgi:hypothetical protein